MSTQSKPSSKEARAKHAKWLRSRESRQIGVGTLQQGGLKIPIIPEFWPDNPELTGYIPRKDQIKDLDVLIPWWPNGADRPQLFDNLSIQWKKEPEINWLTILSVDIPGPIDPDDAPHGVIIPQERFKDPGTYSLRYRVQNWNNVVDFSVEQLIIIDKIPPNYGQEPNVLSFYDASLPIDGITAEYLEAHDDKVIVNIPPYDDGQPTDIVEVYIFGTAPDPDSSPVYSGAFPAWQVDVPGTRIRALPDGQLNIDYHLVDIIGNIGAHSKRLTAELFAKPLPTTPLVAPKVPLAEDAETLIDMEDVRSTSGVEVTVPRYNHWQPQDLIEVDWGGFTFNHAVGTAPENPMIIPVPWKEALQPAYGTGPGVKPTDVSYSVLRGSKRFDSDVITINVDLSLAGPINPDPDPVNPDLVAVTVRGTGASPADNELNADDVGLPATATVPLYDPIGADEQMKLYWGNLSEPVATYEPQTTENPGDTITFNIAWDDIAKEPGQTDLPVFYTLGKITGGNLQHSVSQAVDVTGALPITFGEPTFPDANETTGGTPILNCNSYIGDDHHVRVLIPGNSPLLVGGESVEVTWQGFSDFDGTTAAGDPWTDTRTITPEEAKNGYELLVTPYEDHIEPVGPYGSVRVKYEATVAGDLIVGTAHIWASSTSSAGACFPTP